VRTNNSTRARLGWTFSYIYCIFVHPNLDLVPLFVGMRERSIRRVAICHVSLAGPRHVLRTSHTEVQTHGPVRAWGTGTEFLKPYEFPSSLAVTAALFSSNLRTAPPAVESRRSVDLAVMSASLVLTRSL